MTKWACIAAGGALGSVLRYAMQGWVHRLLGVNFPTGTLAVNVLGCLVVGFLAALFAGPPLMRDEYRIGLTVGVLGGFTTFSTFGIETFNLAKSSQMPLAILNVALSCGLGLAAVALGYYMAKVWL